MFYRVFVSSVNLVYRIEVVEPIVNFSIPILLRPVWSISWLILSVACFFAMIKQKGSSRTLLLYEAAGSFLVFCSILPMIIYLASQNSYHLLASWILILAGIILIVIAELIPPSSPLADTPLSFFRSRILFKFIFIFVLIIVILFEITTLVTLNLSKQALQESLFLSYKEAAKNIYAQIEALPSFNHKAVQKIVEEKLIGNNGIAYIVDSSGTLFAHPDITRVLIKENLKDANALLNNFK